MKPYLKLGFADTFDNAKEYFTQLLSREYTVIRDDATPDYLIFGDPNFGTTHYQYNNCKKILYTGENYRPTYFMHDYSIDFDHENSSKHFRLPLYVLDIWALTKEGYDIDWLVTERPKIDWEEEYLKKTAFCSFVQSNPNVPFRNYFFQSLHEKKFIDSAGPVLNTTGYVIPREGGHQQKQEFLRSRKFNIAIENGSYPGYVTEKILNAYYALSVPLYAGSPTVSRDFTKDSMIQINTDNVGETIQYVLELDQDKKQYLDILSRPVMWGNIAANILIENNFLEWWRTFVYEN